MKRKSFTLIELLVVIAIIGILAAMLLPALSKARAKSRAIACVNKHKQLSMALQMYLDQSDESFPYGSDSSAAAGRLYWLSKLYDAGLLHLNAKAEMIRCPEIFARFSTSPTNYHGDFGFDNFSFHNKQTFAINGTLVAYEKVINNDSKNAHPSWRSPAKLAGIKNASGIYLLGERIMNTGSAIQGESMHLYVGEGDPNSSYYFFPKADYQIHNDRFNYACVDGHVVTTQTTQMKDVKLWQWDL